MSIHDIEAQGPIVLYDGVCGLCHGFVQRMLRWDRVQRLRFAPLQGDTAAALRRRYPAIPEHLDTIVVVAGGRAELRSRAVARAASFLPLPYRAISVLAWCPRALADFGYDLVAVRRYAWFGKHDVCSIPAPEQLARFLP
jgi:predicted DCC family thiol-disulfide oxidoreductase YuxK